MAIRVRRRVGKWWGDTQLQRKISDRHKGYEPFHGDHSLMEVVDRLVSGLGVDTFVETGTFVGDTAKYVATRFPEVQVLTCESNPRWLKLARRFCKGIGNIEFFEGKSTMFLKESMGRLRESSNLFWLDAHWEEHWPLFEETSLIATLSEYVVIVDDFEVPGQPEFHFDAYGGRVNNLAAHKAVLGEYCMVPDYVPPEGGGFSGYGLFSKGIDMKVLGRLPLRELRYSAGA